MDTITSSNCCWKVEVKSNTGSSTQFLANINKVVEFDCFVYTPLHLSLINNQLHTAQFLLESGVSIHQLDLVGQSIVHKAVAAMNIPFLQLLLSWTKDPPDVNKLGADLMSRK